MDFFKHLNQAQQVADTITDWDEHRFSWPKAYVAGAFAAVAYEQLPMFELKKTKRAKIIPCDRYQAHVARWITKQTRANTNQLEIQGSIDYVTRSQVVVAISKLPRVIFISLRGTTLAFSDFKADLDARKTTYSLGFGAEVKFHRGFFDAVIDCFDEVVEKVAEINTTNVPVYIAGHSLGGAMAAIFHARLAAHKFHPFFNRHHPIRSSVSCYSFGMPRYGNSQAKSLLPQPHHVFNEFDAIPTVPPTILGFADTSNERCLNAIPEETLVPRKGNLGLRSGKGLATVLGISDHRLEQYVNRLDIMRQQVARGNLPPMPSQNRT